MWSLLVLWSAFLGAKANYFSEERNAQLPHLFHLDDYSRCLSRNNGLYCHGTFELSSKGDSPQFDIIRQYSSNGFTYNRSRLYRGYCVSERCPFERNATLRFERCVAKRTIRYALTARLLTLDYCTTHRQHIAKAVQGSDGAETLFMQIVYAIMTLNAIGTAYDIFTNNINKNALLMAWSIPASWRKLTAASETGDPRFLQLSPLQGLRVITLGITIYAHCCAMASQFHITNPHFMEKLVFSSQGILLANGTSLIQMFVMMSAFLTSYSMLYYSQKRELNWLMLPLFILKRIIRIAPVYLFLVGYAATWWPYAREGPMMATTAIGENSVICRQKFWSHVFFVNNIVEPKRHCLPPTWFIPVDMHLFILSCALTLVMWRRRSQAIRLYAMLFIVSSVACGVVAYINGWQAMLHFVTPETARGVFSSVDAFSYFYMSSWGSLPACFLGLFMGHMHYELQQREFDYAQCTWLKYTCHVCIPVGIAWLVIGGGFLRQFNGPLASAIYLMFDRPIICLLIIFLLIGLIHYDGPIRSLGDWWGWKLIARLSLPMMLCHWLVSSVIAARPVAYNVSNIDLAVDWCATVFYSILISLPLTILVEIPMKNTLSQFINLIFRL